MDFMMLLAAAMPDNKIGQWLVELDYSLPSFGVTVIVFTIIVRLILSPLDIWQKISQRKQSKAMKRLQPKLARLQKQYANQPQLLRQKQAELQKQEKLHPFASCLPLIVTMVIFFVVFAGFRDLVAYQNETIIENVYTAYTEYDEDADNLHAKEAAGAYVISAETEKLTAGDTVESSEDDVPQEAIDALAAEINAQIKADGAYVEPGQAGVQGEYYAQYSQAFKRFEEYEAKASVKEKNAYKEGLSAADAAVLEGTLTAWAQNKDAAMVAAYEEHMEGFLWIKNIFMPDTGSNVVPSVEEFMGGRIQAQYPQMAAGVSYDELTGPAQTALNKTGTWDADRWNGYFVMPVISIALSFLSTWFTQKMSPSAPVGDAKQQKSQQRTMKILTYVMPVMMGVFAIMYSAAFAIYYFMSNLISTLINVIYIIIVKIIDNKQKAKELVEIK